jgi:hypothetical protein
MGLCVGVTLAMDLTLPQTSQVIVALCSNFNCLLPAMSTWQPYKESPEVEAALGYYVIEVYQGIFAVPFIYNKTEKV